MPAASGPNGDPDAFAMKVAAIVRPQVLAEVLARIPAGQKIEVPPPRVILKSLLQEEVERVRAKIASLNVAQKKMLAYLAAKRTQQSYGDVQKAVMGYTSGPYREQLTSIEETGLIAVDTKHSKVRYSGRELVGEDLRGRFDLTDEDVEAVVAAIENEFAHMLTGS